MVFCALAMGGMLLAAAAQATHPRPKGANQVRVPLVPAYSACAAPNRTHGPPLAFPSCNSPAQTSAQATVGTPDAYGGPSNMVSHLHILPLIGLPGFPDEADIRIGMSLSDVRCVPSGARCGTANAAGPADYSGEVNLAFTTRTTDHWNAVALGGGTEAATVEDHWIDFKDWAPGLPCAETASTSIGSACDVNTTLDSVIPGAAKEKRAIWEISQAYVSDGGADGDGATTGDNTVFLRPGIFIP